MPKYTILLVGPRDTLNRCCYFLDWDDEEGHHGDCHFDDPDECEAAILARGDEVEVTVRKTRAKAPGTGVSSVPGTEKGGGAK